MLKRKKLRPTPNTTWKSFKDTLRLIPALALCLPVFWVHAADEGFIDVFDTVTVEVRIGITGSHPNNAQWDGTRIFYLPIETSNISPPDIVLVVVQPDRIDWYTKGKHESRCPDADNCIIDGVPVDVSHPIGIIVMDHDPLLEFAIDPATRGLKFTAEQIKWAATLDGRLDNTVVGSMMGNATKQLDEIADRVKFKSDRSYDWMDSIILLPESLNDMSEIGKVQDRMRQVIADSIRPKLIHQDDARISGAIATQMFENCLWPAPACSLPYVTVEFREMEAIQP